MFIPTRRVRVRRDARAFRVLDEPKRRRDADQAPPFVDRRAEGPEPLEDSKGPRVVIKTRPQPRLQRRHGARFPAARVGHLY